jgi:tripartite-type tricarboxylate transporter receptor subunit TctC
VDGFEMSTWWGLVAPRGLRKDLVTRLHSETVKALRYPDTVERLAKVGAEPVGSTPQQFAAFIASERTKYAAIVRTAQVKLD